MLHAVYSVMYFYSIIQFLILKISLKYHAEVLHTTSFIGRRVNYIDEVGGTRLCTRGDFEI